MTRALWCLCGLLWPAVSWAVPTPDQLVHTIGFGSWLWGAALAAVSGAAVWLARRGGGELRWTRRLAGALGLLWLCTALAWALWPSREDPWVLAAELEYRCDVGYHEARAQSQGVQARFDRRVATRLTEGAALAERLRAAPAPLLLDLRLPFWRAAGSLRYPDFGPGLSFEQIYPSELVDRLQAEAARGLGARTLVLVTYRAQWLLEIPAARHAELFGAVYGD